MLHSSLMKLVRLFLKTGCLAKQALTRSSNLIIIDLHSDILSKTLLNLTKAFCLVQCSISWATGFFVQEAYTVHIFPLCFRKTGVSTLY